MYKIKIKIITHRKHVGIHNAQLTFLKIKNKYHTLKMSNTRLIFKKLKKK